MLWLHQQSSPVSAEPISDDLIRKSQNAKQSSEWGNRDLIEDQCSEVHCTIV